MHAEKPAHSIAEMCSACQIEWQELNTEMPAVRLALETDLRNEEEPPCK